MKLNKKYSILSILTLISSPTYSQLYMCKACSQGSYAAAGATSCTTCSAGTYSYAGAASCTPCPAGEYQDASGQSSCKRCSVGTYSKAGASSCTKCPAGQWQDAEGKSSCNICPAGTYSKAGSTSCTTCPAGTYSKAGAGSCSPCPDGQWQDATGQSSCKPCSAMRVYYGYYRDYTTLSTPKLKWNTLYVCGNDTFGDPYKGQRKYCTENTHKNSKKQYCMNDGIGISEGDKFQIVCQKTTGNKCIADEKGVEKKCVDKDKWS